MNYTITITFGTYQKQYLAYREGNKFFYDFGSPIGVSTINVGNKRLINYNKYEK